jgi:hypothetical protein
MMAESKPGAERPKIKLVVEHEDGRLETITLRGGPNGDVRIIEGEHLNEIRDGAGMDHFFTKAGHYDGWGGAFSGDEDSARAAIEAMDQKRDIRGQAD